MRFLCSAVLVALAAPTAVAAPRDDVLRVAPPDAALTLVVQNARDRAAAVAASPFAAWFPQSAAGKQFAATVDLKQVRQATAPLFAALGVTPDDVFDDILGSK